MLGYGIHHEVVHIEIDRGAHARPQNLGRNTIVKGSWASTFPQIPSDIDCRNFTISSICVLDQSL